jgi:hypothetical protein
MEEQEEFKIFTIEELYKARTKGAKDINPRKRKERKGNVASKDKFLGSSFKSRLIPRVTGFHGKKRITDTEK